MTDFLVKDTRYSSQMGEILSEAISGLDDAELSALNLLELKVSRGKSDAFAYMDAEDFAPQTLEKLRQKLQKAAPYLQEIMLLKSGKFKTPKLHFIFDATKKEAAKLDLIFKKIADERQARE